MGGRLSITIPASIDNKNERNRCCAMLYSLYSLLFCGARSTARRREEGAAPFKSMGAAAKDDGGGGRRVEETKILIMDEGGGRSRVVYFNGFILDSAASVHATSNLALLSGYETLRHTRRAVRGAGGHHLKICGAGFVRTDRFILNDVLFVPGLEKNVVSVSKLAELDYGVDLGKAGCFIRDARTGTLVGQGRLVAGGLYELDHLKIPLDRARAQQ